MSVKNNIIKVQTFIGKVSQEKQNGTMCQLCSIHLAERCNRVRKKSDLNHAPLPYMYILNEAESFRTHISSLEGAMKLKFAPFCSS